MRSPLDRREIIAFLKAALECSVYVSPLDPGLTVEELLAVGLRAGLRERDVLALITELAGPFHTDKRLVPESTGFWGDFSLQEQPDYRNIEAFEFIAQELQAALRARGVWAARLQRAVLVERAVTRLILRTDVEAAITIWVIDRHLRQERGCVSFTTGREQHPLPSEQRSATLKHGVTENGHRRRAFPLVKNVIEGRTGRPLASTETLDASASGKSLRIAHWSLNS